ncbi:outer membrane protein assembly factor BamC [Leeia aquatica]|uniref:Outer membrane protein assembly factor BamC n=1 Tax=Leeia aquatica TaxID=2725557 RepID=A0A847SAN2_9NEIS|nr:outer membrane protein assembly factor BamC [Leeia aquatica]NLR75977.1 outer membrane protein assembly factor BamC [Leeia aquatica]
MRTTRLLPSCLLLSLLLAGCSSNLFQGKKLDYRSAGEAPGLDVPPDLTRPTYDDRYNMPNVNRGSTYSSYAEGAAAQPQTASPTVLPKVNKVTVERAGNDRWLVVDATPEQLWLPVKDFWQELGFIIKIDEPETGIIETDWAENRALIPDDFIRNTFGKLLDSLYSTDERDKFRTRMERRADGKTEIYISHRGMYEAYANEAKDKTVWQPRPVEPELETEMLTRMMLRLGIEENTARRALADKTNTVERAKLLKGNTGGLVQVNEPFDRAWRRVGLALDRNGFTVVDRNRNEGTYFISYSDERKPESSGGGWFSWLFGSNTPEKKNEIIQYRVMVKGSGDNTLVSVLDKNGQPESTAIGAKITTLLYEQLK